MPSAGVASLLERHLADDLMFFSPPDPGIDRAAYFERCWPNADLIASFRFERLIESGDEVIVIYESGKIDGSRFRNTAFARRSNRGYALPRGGHRGDATGR